MPVPKVRIARTEPTLANATAGNVRHALGHNVTLTSASVGGGGGQPPIRVAIVLGDFSGRLTHLVDGWVRSPPSPASSGMVSWSGRITTPTDDEWDVALLWRNDSGEEVTVAFVTIDEDV